MAIQFYPTERIIQLDTFNVSGREIWTAMVDWSVLGDNLKYGVGMTQLGGNAPIALYLTLERGWRIRPKEADGVTVLSGYVSTAEGTTPMTETLGRWHRQTNIETPVQATLVESAGLTTAQEEKLDRIIAIEASTNLIRADTSELQANQGNFATATGFSTFNPASDTVANVTLVATTTDLTNGGGLTSAQATELTAILTDTNELQGNQGNFATATGFNTVAPDNASIATILEDTNELQTNQGNFATATGFSTFNPTVTAVITDTASRAASKGLTAAQDTKLDVITSTTNLIPALL